MYGENGHHGIPFYGDPTAESSNFIFEICVYDADSNLDSSMAMPVHQPAIEQKINSWGMMLTRKSVNLVSILS